MMFFFFQKTSRTHATDVRNVSDAIGGDGERHGHTRMCDGKEGRGGQRDAGRAFVARARVAGIDAGIDGRVADDDRRPTTPARKTDSRAVFVSSRRW